MKIDKIYLFLGLISVFTVFFWITSCVHNALIDDIPELCFERDVLPIFQNSCAISGCHDGAGESDLVLKSYVPISHAVDPGKPYSSSIYKVIITTSGENKMPPDRPLSLDNRTIIRLWIEQGALLTTCQDTTGQGSSYVNPLACFSRDILPVLVSRCAGTGCHSGASPSGSVTLTNYANVAAAASNSSLLNSMKGNGVTKMPLGGSFSVCRIRQFEIWINNGYLNN
jgi:hypothetical protein